MAGKNVNIFFDNWHATGANVPVPQYEGEVTVEWQELDGTPHAITRTVTFPNDLALVPSTWLRGALKELVIAAVRRYLEIDQEDVV